MSIINCSYSNIVFTWYAYFENTVKRISQLIKIEFLLNFVKFSFSILPISTAMNCNIKYFVIHWFKLIIFVKKKIVENELILRLYTF